MKNLIIALLTSLVLVGLTVACANKEETKILNAFAEQDMGVPEWIEIDWSSDTSTKTSHQITYGLGGRTCHSIVEFDKDNHMTEHARRCGY